MPVFDGVHYSLSPSLSPTRRDELAAILDLNGAVPLPPYTHLVSLPASHAPSHNNASNDTTTLKLVTDRWVDRSIVMGKRQAEQYYSPDPAMIFSGVVACATDLSTADLEVLSAGITALGGQWRLGLTRDVTHLFALRAGSDKYKTALHFAPQTHMCIITPHWFDDAVRLGRRIPETPYAWPDPTVLRPGMTLELNDDPLTAGGKRRRKPADTEAEDGDGVNLSNEGEHVRVWAGRRILLSTSLELGSSSRAAIEAGIQRAGGIVVPITDDADEDSEEKAVDECDVLVTRWRSGKSYFKAARASLLIGTLSWLFSVESSGTLHSPLDSLLWYPTPRGGIPDLVDCEISITNYTGAARDYLKRLIILMGAKFTPSMSQSNKVLVAGFQPSPKTTRALSWSIPVVNHTWLEDCFVEWRALTVGLERYILYPPGIDFGKMLMTWHDGPPSSQSVSSSRLSGGAVPGGRGIGVIDVQQEEGRDAEYCTRTNSGAFAKTKRGDVRTPTEFRVRESSRAGSVKKTPLSALKAKGASVFTPKTPSVTGRFVDHVIELPVDDEEEPGGERYTPTNGKQRAGSSLAGSRVTPQVSTPSSVVFSWPPSEVETAAHDVGEDSTDKKKTDKGKGKERGVVKNSVISSTRPVPEEENSRLPSRSSRFQLQTHTVQGGSEGQAPLQKGGSRRRAKEMTISSDLDLRSDAAEDESEASVPPRRVTGTGSRTPVKSGMKTRPKSKSIPDGEGKNEVEVAETGTATGRGKRREEGGAVTKEKETEKVTDHPRSSTRSPSPTPSDAKTPSTQKRRLSVCIPSLPKDYFSSQNAPNDADAGDREESKKTKGNPATTLGPTRKRLEPAASEHVVAAESSTSTGKRDKPSKKVLATDTASGNSKLQAKTKAKSRPGVPKEKTKSRAQDRDRDVDEDGRDDDDSMIVETPVASTSRTGPRRSAANKATTRLREEVMPDVLCFEQEQKQAKRRRSAGSESVAPVRDADEEGVERNGKKRKVAEEEEEVEVEDVVLVSSHRPKSKQTNGKGKAKGIGATGSNKNMDDPPAKIKPQDKKGTRGQGTIRLMATGVVLSDDVVKRITRLGVQITTKPTDCTHLIAKGFVRTEKFLCAMSVLPHMLREEWATASANAGKLLPENEYLLSDAAAEEKWSFKFTDAMARAKGPEGGSNLFKQMTFYVTPKVAVDTKLLKNVVSAGGGQVQTSTPTVRILRGKANRYVVTCPEDKAIWRPLAQEGFKIYSSELVLRAALRQEIEWDKEECLITG